MLYPQLERMIDVSREIFEDSGVVVGTNGILIPTISDQILNAVKRNDCQLNISGYPPTMQIFRRHRNASVEKIKMIYLVGSKI